MNGGYAIADLQAVGFGGKWKDREQSRGRTSGATR